MLIVGRTNFSRHVFVFDVFEKVKKCVSRNFLRIGPMEVKICAKNRVIGVDMHQTFHLNRIISQK
eukprot:UN08366